MYTWLLSNRIFGRYLRDYREKRGIPMRIKIMTVSLLWATIVFTAFVMLHELTIQIILIAVAAAVTVHVLMIKTKKKDREGQ